MTIAKIIYALGVLLVFPWNAYSEQTTGGVNWLDSYQYEKPAFYPITVPDEATCPNKYYVNQSSGSGTTCSEGSPCNWAGLSGKAGTTGGPAYIYLEGNARLNLNGTLYGSAGSEIVIKPFPTNTSTPITMTRLNSTSSSEANTFTGSNVHHIIMDGGPNMLFVFTGSAPTDENAYILTLVSNNITVARSRITRSSGSGMLVGLATQEGTHSYQYLINCEIYNGAFYGIYIGGGANCTSGSSTGNYIYVINNIIRDIPSSGVQNEPRTEGNYNYFIGNAIHNVSYDETRPALDITATACTASFTNIWAFNNLLFDLGGGGIRAYDNNNTVYIFNNTIYDFAQYSPPQTGSHGIGFGGTGTVCRNNIIMKANGAVNYLNQTDNWTTSNNLCPSGCNYSQAEGSLFSSVDFVNSSNFGKLKVGSTAIDNGYDVHNSPYSSSTDYMLLSKYPLVGSAMDIGAFEYGASGSDTTAPAVTISTADPQNIVTDSLTVAGTPAPTYGATDAVGVTSCKWSLVEAPDADTGTLLTCPECTGTSVTFSGTVTGFSRGVNTLYVGCGDAADNWGSDSITVNYLPVSIGLSVGGVSIY